MRRSPVALVPIAVLLAIAACTNGDDATSPRAIAPRSASNITLSACDFNTTKSDARLFFSRNNDPIFAIISDMSKTTAGSTARDDFGWSAIAEIAKARLTGRQATPWSTTASYGETFAKDVFACMSATAVGDATSLANISDGALALAIKEGVFEVPGLSISSTSPAAAYTSSGLPSPKWGAQPNGTWPSGKYLVFGYPANVGGIYLPTGATINGAYNGFELLTIPWGRSEPWLTPTDTPPIIGACVLFSPGAAGVNNRLIHANAVQVNVSPANLCALTSRVTYAMSSPSQQFFASLGNALHSVFVPKLAYAMFDDEYSGGGPTSWSPNLIGQVSAGTIRITFVNQPHDGFVNVPQDISVKVEYYGTDAQYHPIGGPGVTASLAIVGNNGAPGSIVPPGAVPVDAGTGMAYFQVSFTKAGGYYIAATSNIGGSVTSNQFWIKNR